MPARRDLQPDPTVAGPDGDGGGSPRGDHGDRGDHGGPPRRRTAVNAAIFSVATGLSRIMGLIREIVAARYFGTTGAASAFTLAFQIPNLVRALVADAALSSAYVPVFSDLLEHKRRREALLLASSLAGLLLAALTAICVLFILAAPLLIPVFTGSEFTPALDHLATGLSQVLFPIVVLLGLNGLVVGILNAHEQFTVAAIAPLVWNVVIIAGMVGLRPLFDAEHEIYAYALGVVAGTAVQLAMCLPGLRRLGFPLTAVRLPLRGDPRVRRVLRLMLPVSVGLGLINIDLLLNSFVGSLVSDQAPRAIDAAFRIYMLPQGMFSVAIATVVFPRLSRLASRGDKRGLIETTGTGIRQILMLLFPAGAALFALNAAIVRLVYQGGAFTAASTQLVGTALLWFAFSLPFSGANLLLTRSFFSLQKPWLPTTLALVSLVVNLIVSLATYPSLGLAGPVLGTTVSNALLTVAQAVLLRQQLGGFETARTLRATAIMLAAAAILAAVAYVLWASLDLLLGRSLPAQLVSVGMGLTAGTVAYATIMLASRLPEAHQVAQLIGSRLPRADRRGS